MEWDGKDERIERRVRLLVAAEFLGLAMVSAYWSLRNSNDDLFTLRAARDVLLNSLFLACIGAAIGALFDRLLTGLLIGLLLTALIWLQFLLYMPIL
jgi:hypothetical protein